MVSYTAYTVCEVSYSSSLPYSPPSGVVVGFDPDTYQVLEDVGVVTLFVQLLSGELATSVSCEFFTTPGSAIGMLATAITRSKLNSLVLPLFPHSI